MPKTNEMHARSGGLCVVVRFNVACSSDVKDAKPQTRQLFLSVCADILVFIIRSIYTQRKVSTIIPDINQKSGNDPGGNIRIWA